MADDEQQELDDDLEDQEAPSKQQPKKRKQALADDEDEEEEQEVGPQPISPSRACCLAGQDTVLWGLDMGLCTVKRTCSQSLV